MLELKPVAVTEAVPAVAPATLTAPLVRLLLLLLFLRAALPGVSSFSDALFGDRVLSLSLSLSRPLSLPLSSYPFSVSPLLSPFRSDTADRAEEEYGVPVRESAWEEGEEPSLEPFRMLMLGLSIWSMYDTAQEGEQIKNKLVRG